MKSSFTTAPPAWLTQAGPSSGRLGRRSSRPADSPRSAPAPVTGARPVSRRPRTKSRPRGPGSRRSGLRATASAVTTTVPDGSGPGAGRDREFAAGRANGGPPGDSGPGWPGSAPDGVWPRPRPRAWRPGQTGRSATAVRSSSARTGSRAPGRILVASSRPRPARCRPSTPASGQPWSSRSGSPMRAAGWTERTPGLWRRARASGRPRRVTPAGPARAPRTRRCPAGRRRHRAGLRLVDGGAPVVERRPDRPVRSAGIRRASRAICAIQRYIPDSRFSVRNCRWWGDCSSSSLAGRGE